MKKQYDKIVSNTKGRTQIRRNKNIIGDTIEVMVERLMEGEGIEGIEDRDLVYNDSEANLVNPITNIRSDKFELMLEERIAEQNYKRSKLTVVPDKNEKDKNENDNGNDNSGVINQ